MKKLFTLCSLAFVFIQCSDDTLNDNNDISSLETATTTSLSLEKRNEYLKEFSQILSKSIYDNTPLRKFLKEEALKKFDNDYDILYQLIKNKSIEGKTFREILVSNSSEEKINEIENNIPLLNILITNIDMFDIKPENLDEGDNDTPVIFAKGEKNIYYFNGKEDFVTPKEEIPNFHAFVINENSTIEKIIIPNKNLKSKSISTEEPIITFISPIYDNRYPNSKSLLNSRGILSRNIPEIAKKAYNHFNNSTSGGANQIAFQRDYIYYGLTPNGEIGELNSNIREEINHFSFNPTHYFSFTNDPRNPHIKASEISQNRHEISPEDQIRRMWSDGVYKFKLYNITSNESNPEMLEFRLKPSEIWNFNIEYSRRGGSFWRRSRHTYKIDPKKFTPKIVNLRDLGQRLTLNRWNWDLSKESLHRRIKLVQHNTSEKYVRTQTYEQTYVKETKFGFGGGKLKIGPLELGNAPSANVNSTNTRKEFKSVVLEGYYGDLELGEITVYFYDPVIINHRYNPYRYSFGSVEFSMIPQ
jgi:hypothetical protein